MRRAFAILGSVVVLGVVGYAVADVYDVVPGVLTRDRPITLPTAEPTTGTGPAVTLPTADATTAPLTAAGLTAPLPTAPGLARRLTPLLADPALGGNAGVVVRDALTGRTLFQRAPDTPRMAASTQKLLTAAAVTSQSDLGRTMDTRVVQGPRPTDIVLVAAGDTMLARGRGNPTAIPGRAGLGDLAGQVAAALKRKGTTRVSLRLDLTYAAGPAYAPGWDPDDPKTGVTQGVFMIGLADQRPEVGHPSPTDPPASVARAFVSALAARGIRASTASERTWHAKAPAGATVLGSVSSAPVGDVLAQALDDSDNAMTENLCRQASVAHGGKTSFAGAAAYVVSRVKALGVDTAGVRISDCSGLTRADRVPARVVADVLTLASTGHDEPLASIVARLPVAGLTGSLSDRFDAKATRLVAGVPRAKTGTLIGSSGLAGTTVDSDGRLLSFVVIADHVPASQGTLAARDALDRFVAGLTSCGCR
ncbi:putative D-alanyl-D-alanine carboxypeptidase [Nostocoides japonicum T1-X7]|uniref:Putative D-alanyl-D-alanine carboxypeptidase n=1 Tax=Nostocoides japonicum T1-X7 TaxID=1194083 RepID=A0A077LXG6_9MICO|nr:D-alanyl-D-alanine carboxypeptidase [Tetrasphaera japonica]CCH78386.1 putative D-alanyl-D-alanine carboxypeptidase [Tetrasphaera japonica T1-X7]